MASPLFLQAQLTPMFEMPLYFEDALGHKDSIVVGYDTLGSTNMLLPQFGEVEVTAPFDSVFEVRVIHTDNIGSDTKKMAKKIIALYDLNDSGGYCGTSTFPAIIVKAKYPPIRISYDSSLLWNNECRTYTILSANWNMFFMEYYWEAQEVYCMGKHSFIVDDLIYPHGGGTQWLEVEVPVEGKGIQNLPGYFMQFRYWGVCSDSTLIASKEPRASSYGQLWPNPATKSVVIKPPSEFNAVAHVLVFNTMGQQFDCPVVLNNEGIEMDISRLSPGLYFVKIQAENQYNVVYRLVKQGS